MEDSCTDTTLVKKKKKKKQQKESSHIEVINMRANCRNILPD